MRDLGAIDANTFLAYERFGSWYQPKHPQGKGIHMRIIIPVTVVAFGFMALASTVDAGWFTDETPPANAKPLSEIVKALEDQGYKSISEVEFEDGKWEVEVWQTDGKEIELHIDPVSGKIVLE